MKTIILTTITVLFSIAVNAQDMIFNLDRDSVLVEIKKISETDIEFTYPGETVIQSISKNRVEKIRYQSGRTDTFNQRIDILSEDDFEKVKLTTVASDVVGLTKLGEIEGKQSIVYGGQAKLRKMASEKIRREAAKRGAHIILIQSDRFVMTPVNNVTIQGVAYKY